MGTEYNIWNDGLNPKKTTSLGNMREQLGVILYVNCSCASSALIFCKFSFPSRNQISLEKWSPERWKFLFHQYLLLENLAASNPNQWVLSYITFDKYFKDKEGIYANYKSGKMDGIHAMFNKPPVWKEGNPKRKFYVFWDIVSETQGYVLSFGGRVNKPSVKNFQMIDEKSGKTAYPFEVWADFNPFRRQNLSPFWKAHR